MRSTWLWFSDTKFRRSTQVRWKVTWVIGGIHPIGSNKPIAILFIPKLWMRWTFIDIWLISEVVKDCISCENEKQKLVEKFTTKDMKKIMLNTYCNASIAYKGNVIVARSAY